MTALDAKIESLSGTEEARAPGGRAGVPVTGSGGDGPVALGNASEPDTREGQGESAPQEKAGRAISFCENAELVCEDAGSLKDAGDSCEDASGDEGEDEDGSGDESASDGGSDSDGENDAGDAAVLAAGLSEMPKGLLQNLLSGGKLGSKPLHYAAAKNDVDSLQRLLAQEYHDGIDDLDPFNYTALHVAVESGSEEAVSFLLKEGANMERQTKMHLSRPIHYACFEGHSEVCQTLLEAGCDVDARTDDLRTPLYQASFRGHAECVKVLLDAGADRSVVTKGGKTALDVCGNDAVRDLLEQPAQKKARKGTAASGDE